jgi:hypothetical protein
MLSPAAFNYAIFIAAIIFITRPFIFIHRALLDATPLNISDNISLSRAIDEFTLNRVDCISIFISHATGLAIAIE